MLLTVFNTRRRSLCCQHIHNIRSMDTEAVSDCDSQFTVSLDTSAFL